MDKSSPLLWSRTTGYTLTKFLERHVRHHRSRTYHKTVQCTVHGPVVDAMDHTMAHHFTMGCSMGYGINVLAHDIEFCIF